MTSKSLKQKMIEKLYKEHGIILNPSDLVSFRRNGYGARMVSWSTLKNEPSYQSFHTMQVCLKLPTKLERYGADRAITIEVDLDKMS